MLPVPAGVEGCCLYLLELRGAGVEECFLVSNGGNMLCVFPPVYLRYLSFSVWSTSSSSGMSRMPGQVL